MLPLMSVSRNFFVGSEPTKGRGPFRRFDVHAAGRIATEQMAEIGIDIRDPGPAGGHPLGRRAADARHRARRVLRCAGAHPRRADLRAGRQGGGHRAAPRHPGPLARAWRSSSSPTTCSTRCRSATGSRSCAHGRLAGEFRRGEVGQDELLRLMGGGEELQELARELDELMSAPRRPGWRRPGGRMSELPAAGGSAARGVRDHRGRGGARGCLHGDGQPGAVGPEPRTGRQPGARPVGGPDARLSAVERGALAQAAHDPDARAAHHGHPEPLLPGAGARHRGPRARAWLRRPAGQRRQRSGARRGASWSCWRRVGSTG